MVVFKNKKTQLIDDITQIVMLILTPPVFLYSIAVLVCAVIPTVQMAVAFVLCLGTMLGTLFGLLTELSPVLMIFAIPIGLALMQNGRGNGRR